MKRFFEEQLAELRSLDGTTLDLRALELPLARIKRLVKVEDEVQGSINGRRHAMVSSEAPVVFAKACELFVLELTARAWTCTEENKRRTLQRSDVTTAVSRSDMYDFLIDVVPRHDAPTPRDGDSDSDGADSADAAPAADRANPRESAPPAAFAAAESAGDAGGGAGAEGDSLSSYVWQQQIAAHMFYAQQNANAEATASPSPSRKRKADGS